MKLYSKSKKILGKPYETLLLEQWKTCVEMANCNSEKRISTNNVYITINTAIFAIISSTWSNKNILLSVVGIIVCILWTFSINSYKRLNSEKYKIINEMERKLPTQPFSYEWFILGNDNKYKRFTKVEKALPLLFIILYSISILYPFITCIIKTLIIIK
jgi:uncharacterized membrane protein